ncbi:MAG TPA: hemerythrin domain-containing protein, partial [Candidatus Dormibacteraeota bacterium]|nr:hemerythrin domain-containing protein [Candidatus Dormibacteraeota bacterium]
EEVLEAFEEHHLVDEVLGQLDALPPEAEDWHAKAQVMTEQVQHHIEEEESEMFPEARRAFDADALERMGQRMAGRKKELLAAGDGKR